jgi:hypothetical protein
MADPSDQLLQNSVILPGMQSKLAIVGIDLLQNIPYNLLPAIVADPLPSLIQAPNPQLEHPPPSLNFIPPCKLQKLATELSHACILNEPDQQGIDGFYVIFVERLGLLLVGVLVD